MSSGNDRQHAIIGLALASVVSQVGCLTIVIIGAALLAGLGLDSVLDTGPLFTVLLLLASIPVSLYLSVRAALSAAAQLNAATRQSAPKETVSEDEPLEKE